MLQTLGFKKYSLVGWSDGGIVSLIAAAKYPEEVQKLVVWGSASYVIAEEIEIYESKIKKTVHFQKKFKYFFRIEID